jgi:hypothetical protein
MSLANLLPAVLSLPRQEQVELMHYLVEELSRPPVSDGPDAAPPPSTPAMAYEVFSPDPCPEAADALLKLLADHQGPKA